MTNDERNSGAWFAPALRDHSSLAIRALTLAIRAYQLTLSPAQTLLFGPAGGCRFTPTCSQYALEAVRERGAFTGGWLGLKRICRCHPWGDCGHDPVPQNETILLPLLNEERGGAREGALLKATH